MKNLKLLDIRVSRECDDKLREHLPSSLRFLTWYYFPFSSLPNTFQHLVGLELHFSKIDQLVWEDGEGKVLYNLRFLKIYLSKLRSFDLGLAPNLEHLTIYGCMDFVELHIPADHHSKLQHHLGNTPNLKTLILEGCDNLVLLPELGRVKCLKELDIRKTGIRHLPQSILQLKGLRISGPTEIFESHGLASKIQTSNKGTILEETFAVYES